MHGEHGRIDDVALYDAQVRWLERLEESIKRIDAHVAAHESQPMHAGMALINQQVMVRLDRLEGLVLSVGKWVIAMLIAILSALAAILGIAYNILLKPPAS